MIEEVLAECGAIHVSTMDVIPDLYVCRNPEEIRKGKQASAAKLCPGGVLGW